MKAIPLKEGKFLCELTTVGVKRSDGLVLTLDFIRKYLSQPTRPKLHIGQMSHPVRSSTETMEQWGFRCRLTDEGEAAMRITDLYLQHHQPENPKGEGQVTLMGTVAVMDNSHRGVMLQILQNNLPNWKFDYRAVGKYTKNGHEIAELITWDLVTA